MTIVKDVPFPIYYLVMNLVKLMTTVRIVFNT